MTKDETKKPHS